MDRSIAKPVGDGQKAKNLYTDVVTIQQLLNDIAPANGGSVSGWIHNLVPTAGFTIIF